MVSPHTQIAIIINLIEPAGVGAVDIAKLKTAGYWTVVVRSDIASEPLALLTIDDSLCIRLQGRRWARSRASAM